jgi:hypothetical protein
VVLINPLAPAGVTIAIRFTPAALAGTAFIKTVLG